MSWRSFVSVLIAGALFGLYIGAIVQHGYEATRAARAYVRGYAAAVDSVKAASRVAPDSAWFTGHGADCDTVIVWGWHR